MYKDHVYKDTIVAMFMNNSLQLSEMRMRLNIKLNSRMFQQLPTLAKKCNRLFEGLPPERLIGLRTIPQIQ